MGASNTNSSAYKSNIQEQDRQHCIFQRTGYQRGIEGEYAHAVDQRLGWAGAQFQLYRRPPLVKARQRQAAGRGTFHGADAQAPLRHHQLDCLAGFYGEVEQTFSVAWEGFAGRDQHQAFVVAGKQADAQRLFQLTDAGSDIRLYPMQLFSRAGDAVFPHHGEKNFQTQEIY